MLVPWPGVLAVFALGVAFTVVSVQRWRRERALERRGVMTYGEVTGQQHGPDLRPAPIVTFRTEDGRTVEATSRISSDVQTLVPGRTVTIHYDPADPSEVAIAGYGRAVLRVFASIGVTLIAVAVMLVLVPGETLERGLPVAVPVVLGGTFTGIGGYGVARVWVLRRQGVVTDGTVTGESVSSTREGLTLRHPVVRFALPTGHQVEAPAERGTLRRRAAEGQRVRLSYHRDDPYRMMLVGDGARPLFWLFLLFGVVVLSGTGAIAVLIATN